MLKTASIAFSTGAVIAAGIALMRPAPAAPSELAERPVTACDRALALIDQKIAFHQKRFDRSGWWIDLQEVSFGYLSRAHLTGSYRDYAAADRALVEAFELAEPGSGPYMARARLSFTLHRFDRVEPDLKVAEAAIMGDTSKAAIAELRADLLLYRGRYREAEAAYEAVLAEKRTVTALARLAQYRWKTADFAAAEALLEEAEGKVGREGEAKAWVEMLRGQMALDRGRFAEARQRFETADRAFDGWYLIEQGLAKAMLGLGDEAGATAIYQRLEARDPTNPEPVHGFAAILQNHGEFARAQALHDRVKAMYAEQIAAYPEAFSAHALTHLLGHGDAKGAVEIAKRSYEARPTAESLVLLAQAYQTAGQVAEAETAIRSALATPISTADLHATAAWVLASAGDAAAAEQERAKASTINPAAYETLGWLARAK